MKRIALLALLLSLTLSAPLLAQEQPQDPTPETAQPDGGDGGGE